MKEPYLNRDARFEDMVAKATEQYNDLLRSYYTELGRCNGTAQETARELWQSYVQEIQSAGGGDDFLERTKAAYDKAQQEYEKLDRDFRKSTQDVQRNLSDAMRSLYADYSRNYIGGLIQSLEEIKATIPAEAPRAATQGAEKGKA
jgi:Skp family chaperone for outer membrane proteins